MKIVIDIPEKEFGIDIDDKFKDFFSRLKVEIKQHLITNTSLVCGAYELETIDMFLKAFNDSTPLPEHHGDLIERRCGNKVCNGCEHSDICDTYNAPTIIEADKGVLEKINEKQDSLRPTCKAWDEVVEKDGYVN